MSNITAELVKELRERTGAGMMECKKALVATNGDIEKAIEEMRKSGQAKADKKASRVAAEGIIAVSEAADKKSLAMVEVNCETDFVGRDENFTKFAQLVADTALASGKVGAELAEVVLADGQALEYTRKELINKIGENINVRRGELMMANGVLGYYIHGGRIGAVVELDGGDAALAKDLAMHVAAANPMVVSGEDVPAEILAKEREVYTAQAAESGKPADIVAKMVEGRVRKYLEEVSLLGQMFVKNPEVSVANLLKQHNARVIRFVRFVVGEGIEKQETDFVAEVMQQAGLK
jgi:elongation factor Ts